MSEDIVEKRALEIWREREKGFPGRTQRPTPDEIDHVTGAWALCLMEAIYDLDPNLGLVSLKTAYFIRWYWRGRSLTVGMTNGCFDLIHPGHVNVLRVASETCNRLIVAINSDESVRALKGADRPVQSADARAAVIGAIRGVAAVIVFDELTPRALIQELKPDVLIKGGDYRPGGIEGRDIVEANGGEVLTTPYSEGYSTSRIIQKIKSFSRAW